MPKMRQFEIEKMASRRNLYTDLYLKDYADLKSIKKSYRELAKKYHPDKLINQDLAVSKKGFDKYELVKEAYEILTKHKEIYDNALRKNKAVVKIEKQEIIPDSKTFGEHLSKYELYMIHRQIYIDKYLSDTDACKFLIFNVFVGGISVINPSLLTILLSPLLFDSLFRIIQIWTEFPVKRAGLIEFVFEKIGI